MKIFFNTILIKELSNTNDTNLEKLAIIYDNIQHSKSLIKFPSLYLKFYENYNEILMKNKEIENYTTQEQILHNLVNITNIRNLSEHEER